MLIKNNTFIVTGGASGLGDAVVQHIVEKGGNAVVFDMSEPKESKGQVLHVKVNVVDEASVQAGIDAAVKKFGAVHGVVNCAGVGGAKRVISSSGVVHDLKSFQQIVAINLIGTFNVLRLAAAVMAKQSPVDEGERGVIINVASVAAFDGQIGQAAYSGSKGGVVAMTLPLARDLAKLGIRVNTIAPGTFETPMLAKLPQKAKDSLAEQIPFPSRLGRPKEFAALCGSIIENQYLNAAVIRLDGSLRMAAM